MNQLIARLAVRFMVYNDIRKLLFLYAFVM